MKSFQEGVMQKGGVDLTGSSVVTPHRQGCIQMPHWDARKLLVVRKGAIGGSRGHVCSL